MKSFLCRHPYCSVENRISRSTAALRSTGSVDSTGSDFGITPVIISGINTKIAIRAVDRAGTA